MSMPIASTSGWWPRTRIRASPRCPALPVTSTRIAARPYTAAGTPLGPGVDQPGAIGEDDELDAVAEPELLEDVRDVRLHRGVADHEPLRDLRVGQPARDQPEDLVLARGEVLEALGPGRSRQPRELPDHPLRDLRREQRLPGGDGADGVDELLGRVVLEHEAARSRAQRVIDVLVERERREDEDPRRAAGGEDTARRLEAVHLRHADVHQDDRRLEA